MCSKKFCVQAKGGGHRPVPPPKYATGLMGWDVLGWVGPTIAGL